MGSPSVPDPVKAPPPPDLVKAQLNALAFAETQRRIHASTGRAGSFLTGTSGGSFIPKSGGTSPVGL